LKKVAEVTQLCQGACDDAIRLGREFPFECKNTNDDPEISKLKKDIVAARAVAAKSPEVIEKQKNYESVVAHSEQLRREMAEMQTATAEFPTWADKVYSPSVKTLIAELTKHDDQILLTFAKMIPEINAVQTAAMKVQNTYKNGLATLAEATAFTTELDSVRPMACKSYSVQGQVDAGRIVEKKIEDLNAQLIERVKKTKNLPLFEKVSADLIEFKKKVKLTDVSDDIYNGSLAKSVCNHYRKMIYLNSLGMSLIETSSLRKDIQALILSVDSVIAKYDAYATGDIFVAELREKISKIATDLRQQSATNRWNKGNRLAIEAVKLLHMVIIPAIRLNQNILESFKPLLIEEVTKTLEPSIAFWNNYAQKMGIGSVVLLRRADVQTHLQKLKTHYESQSAESKSQLLNEWKQKSARRQIAIDWTIFQLPAPPAGQENLVQYDDGLSEIETVLTLLAAQAAGVAK
jgi:hypothetical protein